MDYPENSHKSKAEKQESDKKIEKVVKGDISRRKKPLGRRFAETFIQGDARSAWGYVALDVLLPAAKDMVADAFTQGVEKMLYGEARSSYRRGGSPKGGGYTAYNRAGGSVLRREDPRDRGPSRAARAQHNFDDIIIPTRVEAIEVLERMYDLLSKFEVVTLSDMYDLVGVTASFTDEKWGWTDLRGSDVRKVRDGYLLDLPRPVAIS